ncbi:MAG: transporter substrate-binding domain-containing protein [Proteobacteria bacterium]|nr:transporter substrate-binding domain-containing protein [Pseudomonadota bacterium]
MKKFLNYLLAGALVAVTVSFTAGAAVAATAKAQTSPVLTRIAESGTLKVGMSGGQPPFNMKTRTGDIIGMEVDLAGLLAASLGVDLEIVELPFSDLLDALDQGKVDLVMSGMTATLRRNMNAAFVGPYYITGKTILARSETIARLQSQQLGEADVTITALKGSTSEDFVKAVAPGATLKATATYDQAIDLLLADKADAFVADASIVILSMMRWPDAGLVAADKALTIEPIGIAVSPSDPLLLNLVQNYVEALKATGVLEELRKAWFENPDWIPQIP